MKKIIVFALMVFPLLISAVEDKHDSPSVEQLKEEVSRLQKENEALRKENQKLRMQIVNAGKTTSTSGLDGDKTTEKTSAVGSDGEYWLTTSSKKRHNSKCRNFKNTKGRPCTKDEGTACKRCGG